MHEWGDQSHLHWTAHHEHQKAFKSEVSPLPLPNQDHEELGPGNVDVLLMPQMIWVQTICRDQVGTTSEGAGPKLC